MKKMIAIMLLAILTISLFSTTAFAAISIPDLDIQRVSCTSCGGLCYTYCYGDRVFLDQGTHGVLSKCTVTAYKSRGAYQCGDCGKIQQNQGYHECTNVHADCGKGTVVICVMNGGVY